MKTFEEAEKKSLNPFYVLWWIQENASLDVEKLRQHFMLQDATPETRRKIFRNLRQTLMDLNAVGIFEPHFLFNENIYPALGKNPFCLENEILHQGQLKISDKGKMILELLDISCEIMAEHPPRESMWITPYYGKIQEKTDSDIFVLMPFRKELNPVYEAIGKVANSLQRSCHRADNLDHYSSPEKRNEIMRNRIWPEIASARQIIVDLTGLNPNVFYELGIADTIGRPVLFIMNKQQEMVKTPFDITHREIYKYDRDHLGAFEKQLEGLLKGNKADIKLSV